MSETAFDEYAAEYDSWFLKNPTVLRSEVLLLAGFLKEPGRALSVGCGSGLFEKILREEHGIDIHHGVEPARAMAEIAGKRGMEVRSGTAQELPFDDGEFDPVIFNGSPSYIEDLERAFGEAHRVLREGGSVVVADVPAESSYGLLYQLAAERGGWEDPSLQKAAPEHPYPVPFVAAANWRTTGEKAAMLEAAGFRELEYLQTLTCHPKYSNDLEEEPVEGFDRGDYVAIRATRSVRS